QPRELPYRGQALARGAARLLRRSLGPLLYLGRHRPRTAFPCDKAFCMTRLTAPFLDDPALKQVLAALSAEGAQALIVGGAVRNALLGEPVADVDIATSARPGETLRLAETAGLRTVPTGIDHGTITVIAGGRGFEVTSFRRDVETFGRRAVVAYSD